MNADTHNQPLTPHDMDRLMAALGPFETSPHLAVAVSGGADSMGLVLLADAWVRARGGKLSGLTVDHGLRPGSAEEARQVGEWLRVRQIDHHVLPWLGDKPATGVQAAARTARYGLMENWCRQTGVLHLLLAHQLEDQAETFLMRLARSPGVDGLAGMSAIIEKGSVRLLRPLLSVAKDRLRATLRAAQQSWVEDPSNDNPIFERVRVRRSLSGLVGAGLTPEALVETAKHMARARIALEDGASKLLARCCSLSPAGYARVNGEALFAAPEEISLRALSRVLQCVGGAGFPPASRKLERFHEKMKSSCLEGISGAFGATLSQCRVLRAPGEFSTGVFLICRENRFLPQPVAVETGKEYQWDCRFRTSFSLNKVHACQGVSLQALGDAGWSEIVSLKPEVKAMKMPQAVGVTLPALADERGVLAAPHLKFHRYGEPGAAVGFEKVVFQPRQSLSGAGFIVAE